MYQIVCVIIVIFISIYLLYININITKSKYISSRNFPYLCDHHITNLQTSSIELPITIPKKHGESIYITTDAIPNFILNYLPQIKYRFVLVTGDSDLTIPDNYVDETNKLLSHPLLLKWYAQNYRNIYNSKIDNLPIGLDLHTLITKPLWGKIQTEDEQLKDINKLKSLTIAKLNQCYSNFHFNLGGKYCSDRKEAIERIQKNIVYYEPYIVNRINSWNNMIKFKYTICPHGNGLDCHRNWEALILGCIPIVKKSDIDNLYENLPVIIVDNWSDVNYELLNNYKFNNIDKSKLYIDYWQKLFNQFK